MEDGCPLRAARAIQRVVPGGHDALEVRDDARIDLVGPRARQISGHLAVLGGERRNLARRQTTDAGALHEHRRGAEFLPCLALLLYKSLGGGGYTARGAGLGPRRKAAAALALFVVVHFHPVSLVVRGSPRDALL